MKLADIKPIILELITESLFGKKLKVDFGPFFDGGLMNAIITKNTKPEKHYDYLDMMSLRSDPKEEKYYPYKMSWFEKDSDNPKIPIARGHVALTYEELLYIIAKKKFSDSVIERMKKLGRSVPRIKGPITETLTNQFVLIIGMISMDGEDIEAINGTSNTSHKSLIMKRGYPWRYNELSDNLYWRQEMPPNKYREKVRSWLEDKGYSIKHEIDLDNLPPGEYYIEMWNDAHGIYTE